MVGLPNAGKSTFLSVVSAAKPKIADYPFTTLHPNLGVVAIDEKEFVMADIPGLIKGAHRGLGLGDRFLGHIERCNVLLHLIDGTQPEPLTAYETIRRELAAYGGGLTKKFEIVAITKADALTNEQTKKIMAKVKGSISSPTCLISAPTKLGIQDLLSIILEKINKPMLPLNPEAKKLQEETGVGIIFITHDFGVVAKMCDRVAVMYAGKIVEQADVREIFNNPQHPYTQALIASVPKMEENVDRLYAIPGNPPILSKPTLCQTCDAPAPVLVEYKKDHWVAKCAEDSSCQGWFPRDLD